MVHPCNTPPTKEDSVPSVSFLDAFAWGMASSPTQTTEYHVMVVGHYVVIGWGPHAGSMSYTSYYFRNPGRAKQFAVDNTWAKEDESYQLKYGPCHLAMLAPDSDWLDMLIGRKSYSTQALALWRNVIMDGTIAA
jgi:hypothetical protein